MKTEDKIKELEKRIEMLELLVKALSNTQVQYVPTYIPQTPAPITPWPHSPTWICGHNVTA